MSMGKLWENKWFWTGLYLVWLHLLVGFGFGIISNEEEVPLIYEAAGLHHYPNDPFVSLQLGQFNVVWSYVYALAPLARLVGFGGMPALFFLLNLGCGLVLYLAFRQMLRRIVPHAPEWVAFGLSVWMVFMNRVMAWVPNVRSIVREFFDPEILTMALLFPALFAFLQQRHRRGVLLLALATIVHPLYALNALPMIVGLLAAEWLFAQADLKRQLKVAGGYVLAVLPWSVLIWWVSRQTCCPDFNAVRIHEIVGWPEHLVIPSLRSHGKLPYIRYVEESWMLMAIGLLLFGLKRWHHLLAVPSALWRRSFSHPFGRTFWFGLLGFGYLLTVSVIASFAHIDMLVALTPWRMVVVLLGTTALVLWAGLWRGFQAIEPLLPQKWWQRAGILVLVLLFAMAPLHKEFFRNRVLFEFFYPEERNQVIDWIRTHTDASDGLLNYSDIAVRTLCLRPSFFDARTIPTFSDGQIDWYLRRLVYFDIPEHIDPHDYEAVARAQYDPALPIDVRRVAARMPEWVTWAIVTKNETMFPRPLLTDGMEVVFSTPHYQVIRLRKTDTAE